MARARKPGWLKEITRRDNWRTVGPLHTWLGIMLFYDNFDNNIPKVYLPLHCFAVTTLPLFWLGNKYYLYLCVCAFFICTPIVWWYGNIINQSIYLFIYTKNPQQLHSIINKQLTACYITLRLFFSLVHINN
jgi:hypothetical protein